jgi:arylsulfatase A-like enzyme
MLAALPALTLWLVRAHAPIAPSLAARMHRLTLGLGAVVVMLDHADNEVMRFMGIHLTANLLRTYADVAAWGSDMGHILAEDRGGPMLPFVVLAAGPLLLWMVGHRIYRRGIASETGPVAWSSARTAILIGLLLGVPVAVYNLPGSRFRRARVQPELLTLAAEWRRGVRAGVPPADLDTLVARHQREWRSESADTGWTFVSPRFPLLRAPSRQVAQPSSRHTLWNVIYLQLETFRGWNVGFLNPDPRGSATPFLDSLATGAHGAYWSRFLSFGPPTVSGFIAGHCSVLPHSRLQITTTFTYTGLSCLPAVLRRHGWRTAYFTGSDPDWDNQTLWLRRWYDDIAFYRQAAEDDRVVFREAAARIRDLGRGGAPFFATVVSISNHYPFRSREPALDLTTSREPAEAVRNTMHYTDDVVREFVATLSREPWFDRTLLVVVGDHGYNLGEHDGTAGQRNGWRESTWVPLLITAHPRLNPGRHDVPASLIDIAPTVADLLGIRDTVGWMGHSLVTDPLPGRPVTGSQGLAIFAEQGRWSLVVDPNSGERHLYDAVRDPLQRRDLGREFADTARALERHIDVEQALVDYLLESNRITPERIRP